MSTGASIADVFHKHYLNRQQLHQNSDGDLSDEDALTHQQSLQNALKALASRGFNPTMPPSTLFRSTPSTLPSFEGHCRISNQYTNGKEVTKSVHEQLLNNVKYFSHPCIFEIRKIRK